MNSSSSSVAEASSTVKMAVEDSQPQVLIVDADATGRANLKAIFMKYSCKVSTVENWLQALRLLGVVDDPQTSGDDPYLIPKIDIIMIDYDTLAGMTGHELVKKIKESSATKDVRVVVVSSEDDLPPESDHKCLEAGAYMFINKPFVEAFVEVLIEK